MGRPAARAAVPAVVLGRAAALFAVALVDLDVFAVDFTPVDLLAAVFPAPDFAVPAFAARAAVPRFAATFLPAPVRLADLFFFAVATIPPAPLHPG
jgi:hypothetical protein